MTDQEYIQAIKVNDQKIIGQIYSRFRSSTLGYLRKHTTLDDGDIFRHIISDMGEPCLSLLKAFYWDELSFEEIARKLPNYSTADSARNNKSRCVSKLRSYYEKLTS